MNWPYENYDKREERLVVNSSQLVQAHCCITPHFSRMLRFYVKFQFCVLTTNYNFKKMSRQNTVQVRF